MNLSYVVKKYKVAIIIMAGLLLGTAYANIGVKYWGMSPKMFSNDFLAVYEEVEVNSFSLWQYVFGTRFKDFLAVLILSFTNLRKVAVNGYIAYFGIVTGGMISFAVMNHGATGVWIYLLSVLPQYILYIIAYRVIYMIGHEERVRSGNDIRKHIFMVIFIISLVFAGTYVEAYINPAIMRWVYSWMWF